VEIVRVESEAISVELLPEVGARLHRLRAFGHDLLRTPDDPATHAGDPFFWGAYVLAPWANRIDARPTPVGDRTVDLSPNFPDGSAIHGQVYARAWERRGDGLGIDMRDSGWPWPYEVTIDPSIEGNVLHLDLVLVNRSDSPMPAGLGLHPWWRKPVEVAIASESFYPTTTDSASSPDSVRDEFDLRRRRSMPSGLDAAWTGLKDPAAELFWPAAGIRVTMHGEGGDPHVVAASPPELDAVAVELQSHAPQGLRRTLAGEPGSLALVDPGDTLRFKIMLRAERTG
jgi:aldose 1-epimerase